MTSAKKPASVVEPEGANFKFRISRSLPKVETKTLGLGAKSFGFAFLGFLDFLEGIRAWAMHLLNALYKPMPGCFSLFFTISRYKKDNSKQLREKPMGFSLKCLLSFYTFGA